MEVPFKMQGSGNKQDIRYSPMYTMSDVSHFTQTNVSTLRTWTMGRAHPTRSNRVNRPILFHAGGAGPDRLSFMNIIETHVLSALRNHHRVPLSKIRMATEWLRRETGTKHPLAELNIETDGRDVFVRFLEKLVSASEHGQVNFPDMVGRYLERIERDASQIPLRLYPFTNTSPDGAGPKFVMIDPSVGFGHPVITDTGIATSAIFERFAAGESQSQIAEDYGLKAALIEEAVRYEAARRAA